MQQNAHQLGIDYNFNLYNFNLAIFISKLKLNQLQQLYKNPHQTGNNNPLSKQTIQFVLQMDPINLSNIVQQNMNKIINDQGAFLQLARIFNINTQSDANSKTVVEEKLKNKFLDIFLTEGNNYQDYLQLPKFNILKAHTLQKLNTLFNQIWKQYCSFQTNQKKQKQLKQIEKYIPTFNKIDQIQLFHFQLLQEYKQSKLSPFPKLPKKRNNPFPRAQQPMDEEYLPQPDYYKKFKDQVHRPQQNNNFIKYNNPQSANNGKIMTKIQDDEDQIHRWNQNQYNTPSNGHFPMPMLGMPGLSTEQYNYLQNRRSRSNMGFNSINDSFNPFSLRQEEQSQKLQTYFTGELNQLQNSLEKYMFLECPCQGNLKNAGQYMACKKCKFYFHFRCLLSQPSPLLQICPCCKLKEGSNIFVTIYNEALGKRWYKNLKSDKLTFCLTKREIQTLKALKQHCKSTSQIQYQLRFQKIVKRTHKQLQSKSQQKQKKYSSLPLPPQFIQTLKPNNMFQINIKFPDESKEAEQHLFFFAIFVVERLSQTTTVEQYFANMTQQNSVGQEYLKNLATDKQFIDLNMKDRTTQMLVKYPVRGKNCDHAEVFDYLQLLISYKAYGEKFRQLFCPECDNPCEKIVIDRFINQQIREAGERYQEQPYETLRYYPQESRIQWNPQVQQQNASEPGSDQDAQQSSSSSSESQSMS